MSAPTLLRHAGAARDADARCPACHSRGPGLRYRLTRFRVYACRRCRLVYLWPRADADEIRALFRSLYAGDPACSPALRRYFSFSYDDAPANPQVQRYERWLDAIERIRPPGRLLDIGCGTGLFLAVARRRGWLGRGVDDCAQAAAHARGHFGLEVRDGRFGELPEDGQRFDAITLWDVLEHAPDPLALLRAARRRLAAGGVLGLSLPNQRSLLELVAGALYRASRGRITAPLEQLYVEQHFAYFHIETLRATLARADLEIVQHRGEHTDLRRLELPAPVRLGLRALFAVARAAALENRLFVLARPAEPRAQPAACARRRHGAFFRMRS